MATIEVDNDVYSFLAERVMNSGQSPSELLRRELKIPPKPAQQPRLGEQQRKVATSGLQEKSALAEFIASPKFMVQSDAVGKFLALMSWLYKRDPNAFKIVTIIRGSKRKYIAESEQELEAAGRSVMPKRIPDSPFWVVTNNSTALKKKMLQTAMSMLGCAKADIEMAMQGIW